MDEGSLRLEGKGVKAEKRTDLCSEYAYHIIQSKK